MSGRAADAPRQGRRARLRIAAEETGPGATAEEGAVAPRSGGSRTPVLQSATKALRVLELIAGSPTGLSAKEIAGRLDLALPSTYHLLTTLVDAGYVVHLSEEARYGIGSKARFLGQALTRQLAVPREVAAAIKQVHVDADAAAYYAVYRETDVVIAHVEDSDRRPRVQPLDVGFDEAAHATAFGKVMLSAMAPEECAAHLGLTGCPSLAPSTITDAAELTEQLSHVRESGIALELEEFQRGLGCMAAPVQSRAGAVVASVAISLPVAELRKRRWHLERVVRHGAARVTRALARARPHAPGPR
ncbi:DNA-binding IclR family transcriptional regulator [Spinactinospora alkalitolerans]|uniref:DNA-binding IclR family transcriptional regulator n=1 Tax=Spinactinospora alkalitolerans TaxID=687207 RepID=A0A852U5R8_9ACTN|nr:IclR family transcriptional regulator [Spinactinospora alkalitolerans]NYE50935.1 DNA-binding IclR family transcriptional regulator [Spinactinospora alkalitolerans]